MSTGVLAGQVVLVFAVAALGVAIATQWTAAALGFQARLGEPWFTCPRHADLLPVAALSVVVLVQRVRTRDFPARRRHRSRQRVGQRSGGHRCVGMARPPIEAGHDIRLRPLGHA